METWKIISEIFYNFALGVAALGGGFFVVVKAIISAMNERKKNKYIDEIKKSYPRKLINKKYLIADAPQTPGMLFLIDIKKKEKYWIQTGETLIDLGFAWSDSVRLQQNEFDAYSMGTALYTRGKK